MSTTKRAFWAGVVVGSLERLVDARLRHDTKTAALAREDLAEALGKLVEPPAQKKRKRA